MTSSPDTAARRSVTWLLVACAVGVVGGRLLSAERLHEPSVHRADEDKATPRPAWPAKRPAPSPTFSSNDRSRWALVRALVENGEFVVGRRHYDASGKYVDTGIIFDPSYGSVDKVLHPERKEFYSTKPPLLAVIVAGEYWVLYHVFGLTMEDDPFTVVRLVLVTINLVPFAVYLVLLGRLAERFAAEEWSRYFVVAAGGFATLMTPFLVSFNNHTIATAAALVAVWAVVRIAEGGGVGLFALAGLMCGFTAIIEYPATSLAAGLFVYLLWRQPRRALVYFLPAALLPVAAHFALNYAQLGELTPAYAKFGTEWYEYEGSHWRVPAGTTKRGIDFAGRNGETKATYALHLLVGHHGLFLLMPVLALAFVGMAVGLLRPVLPSPPAPLSHEGRGGGQSAPLRRLLSLFTLLLSAVVIGFYLYKTDNYGGWSNGPRWLMWLTPLWLLAMLPVLDWLAARRWGRALALILLIASAASMNYQSWSPWRHPWAYNWMESRGWVNY